MKFKRFVVLGLALWCSVAAANQTANKPIEIWFKPLTWTKKVPGPGIEYTKLDFPALLQPDAPWQSAASKVTVFMMPGNVVWSYPDLPGLIAFINSHHLKVAFADGMLFNGGTCGIGIEGMSKDADKNRETVALAKKWKAAGGRWDYIVMDGPLYFGFHYAKDCHYSMQEVANKAAATLKGVMEYFPDIHVADAEGPGEFPNSQWLSEMQDWFKTFREASGKPIEAVTLDLHWKDRRPGQNFQDTTQRATQLFHTLGVRSGLVVNAESNPMMTDETWMDDNRRNARAAAAADLNLDFVLINSWHGHPSHNLPETDPEAYTSLIDYVCKLWECSR